MSGGTDFSQLLAELASETFKKLRPQQLGALEAYSARHTQESDVGIELPTGAGKSLIALLIAERWRRQGKTAAVLTANKALAGQMKFDAEALNLPAELLEGPGPAIPGRSVRRVNRGRAIGVMNYWVYFNQNPVLDPVDLLVLDDVHLADAALQALFSVRVTRRQDSELFEEVAAYLAEAVPSYPAVRHAAEASGDPFSPTDLIAPHDHQRVISRVGALIANSESASADIKFQFSRVRDQLDRLLLYVAADELVIRPYVWPLQDLPAYRNSTQRLYLSATLGSATDLQRRLGSAAVTKVKLNDDSDELLGSRLLVLGGAKEDDDIGHILNFVATQKALWLTRSGRSADKVQEVLRSSEVEPIWRISSRGEEISAFKKSPDGHLIGAGRFDGLDFPGNTCRVVVVFELPTSIDPQETFVSEQLRDAGFLLERLNSRIVQSLGRANRSADDFAVYVLADKRFSSHLRRDANRRSLPALINAEVDVAQDRAARSTEEVISELKTFLSGDTQREDTEVADALEDGLPPQQPADAISAEAEVEGWRRLVLGDTAAAEEKFAEWASEAGNAGLREQAAFALVCAAHAALAAARAGDPLAETRAERFVERAVTSGGRQSTWFIALASSVLRSARQPAALVAGESAADVTDAFDRLATATGGSMSRFKKTETAATRQLTTGSHAEFQEGMETLARYLGIQAVRPKGSGATDIRWEWAEAGRRQLMMTEIKVDHEEHGALSISDVDQANGQLTSARTEFEGRGVACRGILVSHLEPDRAARGRLGEIVLVEKSAIAELWKRVADLFREYLRVWEPDDPNARTAARDAIDGKLPADRWLTRVLDQGVTVTPDVLLADWP